MSQSLNVSTRRSCLALAAGILLVGRSLAADIAGSADPAGLKRLKGSSIVGYERKSFDTYAFPTGRFERYDFETKQRVYASSTPLEGAVTRLWYEAPGLISSTEMFRNYINDLQKEGFVVQYESTRDLKPRPMTNFLAPFGQAAISNSRSGFVFFAAKESSVRWASLRRGGTHVVLTTVDWPAADAAYKSVQGAYAAVDVIEVGSMQEAMVAVSAQEMDQKIAVDGRVALYGVLFETDSSALQDASRAALTEIAKLLALRPSLRLRVVGHTDNEGSFDRNQTLSRQRAKSVVDYLVANEKVAPARLAAYGVGDLAPVASNKTAEGRAKNRRVELVPI